MDPGPASIVSVRVGEVRSALSEELKASPTGIPFQVGFVSCSGGLMTLELWAKTAARGLDESFEDGRLGWDYGGRKGNAEIISVLPQISTLHAWMEAGNAPRKGDIVFINPPRYLEIIHRLWHQSEVGARAVAWEFGLNDNSFHPELALGGQRFGELRPAQKEAFRLVGWDARYLWGPPGTGKTTTLGCLVAEYLRNRKASHILLVSSTNVAVDTALLSVDERVKSLFPKDAPPLLRFGSRFDPAKYERCRHLVPVRDKSLIGLYEQHLKSVPSPSDPEQYRVWRKKLEVTRERFAEERRLHLKTARVAGMTATYAVSLFDELANTGKYDLVVCDEASQVGKAYAMTLATLGRAVLFAGDHKQLSPIVQSESVGARSWLGKSAFDWITKPSLDKATCMLEAQFRMAPAISGVISDFFYRSKLRVADEAAGDPAWLADRRPKQTVLLSSDNVCLIDVQSRARPGKDFAGYCCPESAAFATAVAVDLQLSCTDEDLCILTPFRAQRREIEKELQARNASVRLVSTVHRVQGLERQSVIFDPVCPSSAFVSDEGGMRLINVALSRAKSRLVVLMQSHWIENRFLQFLAARFPLVTISESGISKMLGVRLAAAPPMPAPKLLREETVLPANTSLIGSRKT